MRSLWWLFCLFSIAAYGDPDPGIRFIENKTQWRKPIQYSAKVKGGNMTLLPGKIQYMFLDQQRIHELHDQFHVRPELDDRENKINGVAIEVEFVGANQEALLNPFGKFPEYYNYYT